MTEQNEQLGNEQTPEEELRARVATLEKALHQQGEILLSLRKDIVTITADHIQRLFNDEVLLDSLSQRILVAGANAIAYKAKASRQRAPELVVVEGYVPGSVRGMISEDGSVELQEQNTETQEWVGGEATSEGLRKPETIASFGELLIGYGAQIGRWYYIIDNISLEEFRTSAAKRAMEVTGGADAANDAQDSQSEG